MSIMWRSNLLAFHKSVPWSRHCMFYLWLPWPKVVRTRQRRDADVTQAIATLGFACPSFICTYHGRIYIGSTHLSSVSNTIFYITLLAPTPNLTFSALHSLNVQSRPPTCSPCSKYLFSQLALPSWLAKLIAKAMRRLLAPNACAFLLAAAVPPIQSSARRKRQPVRYTSTRAHTRKYPYATCTHACTKKRIRTPFFCRLFFKV